PRPSRSTLSPYTTLFRSIGLGVFRGRLVGDDAVHGGELFEDLLAGQRTLGLEVAQRILACLRLRGHIGGDGRDQLAPVALLGCRSEEHTSELQSLAYLVC